ncbi:hypothetical protein BS47DRAFT_1349734, partial [Hydnum rufescens UP504]
HTPILRIHSRPSSTEGLHSISTRFLTPGYRVHFPSPSIIPPITSTLRASNTVLADAPLNPCGRTI